MLFRAGVHPKAGAGELGAHTRELFQSMKEVLEGAIDWMVHSKGVPEGWLLSRRERGGRCPRCGGEIQRAAVSGRSSYFCPRCQRVR